MNAMRRGAPVAVVAGATVSASADRIGTREANVGIAMLAPAPRRNRRRFSVLLFGIVASVGWALPTICCIQLFAALSVCSLVAIGGQCPPYLCRWNGTDLMTSFNKTLNRPSFFSSSTAI